MQRERDNSTNCSSFWKKFIDDIIMRRENCFLRTHIPAAEIFLLLIAHRVDRKAKGG
jgi:hypothetical protein